MLHVLTLTMYSLDDFVLKVLIYDFFVITRTFIVLFTDARFAFQLVRIAYIDVVLKFGYYIIDIKYTVNFNFRYS
jgi:hypothetical protein